MGQQFRPRLSAFSVLLLSWMSALLNFQSRPFGNRSPVAKRHLCQQLWDISNFSFSYLCCRFEWNDPQSLVEPEKESPGELKQRKNKWNFTPKCNIFPPYLAARWRFSKQVGRHCQVLLLMFVNNSTIHFRSDFTVQLSCHKLETTVNQPRGILIDFIWPKTKRISDLGGRHDSASVDFRLQLVAQCACWFFFTR